MLGKTKKIIDKYNIVSKPIRFLYSFYVGYLKKKDNKLLTDYLSKNSKPFTLRQQDTLFSLVVPIYNTPKNLLNEMIDSVKDQTYSNWELILVDDKSTDKNTIANAEKYVKSDKRIKLVKLVKNLGISGATNKGIEKSKGDFICLLDHDDILHCNALSEAANIVKNHPNVELIYTDEAKIKDSVVFDPFFKTGWNPEFIRSVNYITHFTSMRRATLERCGFERSEFDGAQDWELFMRISNNIDPRNIYHIPKILYFWRVHSNSTSESVNAKPYVVDSQRRLLEEYYKENSSKNISPKISDKGCWYRIFKNENSLLNENDYDLRKKKISIVHEGNTIEIYNNTNKKLPVKHINRMIYEVLEGDNGVAVSCLGFNKILTNLKYIIKNKEIIELIQKMSRISLSKNIYQNTSYNLEKVGDYDYMVINVAKNKDKILNIPIVD